MGRDAIRSIFDIPLVSFRHDLVSRNSSYKQKPSRTKMRSVLAFQSVGDLLSLFWSGSKSPLFLSIQAIKGARFSANMCTFYSYISNPNGTGNSPFGAVDTIRNLRSLRGTSYESRKCALLYRCPTCISRALRGPCLLCPNTADRRRGRESISALLLPRPPRAAALAPLRGYPKLMVAVLLCRGRRHGQLPFGPVASSTRRRSKHDHEGGSR